LITSPLASLRVKKQLHIAPQIALLDNGEESLGELFDFYSPYYEGGEFPSGYLNDEDEDYHGSFEEEDKDLEEPFDGELEGHEVP